MKGEFIMYIDKTYPFEPIKLDYDFSMLDSCMGCESLFVHYNSIYIPTINKLNHLLSRYPDLQSLSLDELIFNSHSINIKEKDDLTRLTNSVYNHHVFFSSITPCNYKLTNSPIKSAIERSFLSVENFYQQFMLSALSLYGSGYIYLVCNEHGTVSIFTTRNHETPIPYNLYPLIALDMWEHSYFLKFKTDKEKYINTFFNLLNWQHINNEYIECEKCVMLPN